MAVSYTHLRPSRSLKSPPSRVGRPAVFGAADASERASEMFLRTGAFFSSILSELLKNLVALQAPLDFFCDPVGSADVYRHGRHDGIACSLVSGGNGKFSGKRFGSADSDGPGTVYQPAFLSDRL